MPQNTLQRLKKSQNIAKLRLQPGLRWDSLQHSPRQPGCAGRCYSTLPDSRGCAGTAYSTPPDPSWTQGCICEISTGGSWTFALPSLFPSLPFPSLPFPSLRGRPLKYVWLGGWLFCEGGSTPSPDLSANTTLVGLKGPLRSAEGRTEHCSRKRVQKSKKTVQNHVFLDFEKKTLENVKT